MTDSPSFTKIAQKICSDLSYANPSYVGSGAFKEAYITKDNQDAPIALKIFDPQKCNLCRSEREINAMQQCNSPFIAKIYDWGTYHDAEYGSFLFIIEEYFSGGTLTKVISSNTLTESTVCDYGIILINAISHLRERFLVHRDIKPENIMFREGDNTPILVDFGLVRNLSNVSLTLSNLQQGPGTPFFASPEQLNNEKYLIDWRSDQFSLGVVLGFCLTGIHPYQQNNDSFEQTVVRVINRSGCSSNFEKIVQSYGFGFVTKMLSPWPIDRYPNPELLRHEFNKLKKELAG